MKKTTIVLLFLFLIFFGCIEQIEKEDVKEVEADNETDSDVDLVGEAIEDLDELEDDLGIDELDEIEKSLDDIRW